MKETAMQQLINKVMEWQAHTKSVIEKDAFNDCILLAELLLPTEKQQIEDAWQDGQNSVQCYGGSVSHCFKDYYSKTYKTD